MTGLTNQLQTEAGSLLRVSGLSVDYCPDGSPEVHALADISFSIHAQEIVGILGESGSGKSTLALSLLDLLPPADARSSGAVHAFTPAAGRQGVPLRQLRGHTIAAIFQEPGISLNPVMQVGKQVAEVLHAHNKGSWKQCLQLARVTIGELFSREEADRIFTSYPHQLSGGQRQRILIAQAIACKPALLIADEPTASLDATVQMDTLLLLKKLVREREMAMVFISHDPQVLRMMADRVMVMYAGRIVESGPLEEVFQRPKHPYTQALLELVPHPERPAGQNGLRLPTIPAGDADPSRAEPGCAFYARCPVHMEECRSQPPPEVAADNHAVRCFKYGR